MDENVILDVEQSFSDVNVISEPSTDYTPSVLMIDNTYTGTISDTYLNYFVGIVEKLSFNEHYLIWRTGQNEYTMAYGDDLSVNGYLFTGSDLWITRIYRENDSYVSNYYISHTIDDISVDCSSLFVYSDLGDIFPTVKRGFSSVEATSLFFAFCVLFVFIVLNNLFKYVRR